MIQLSQLAQSYEYITTTTTTTTSDPADVAAAFAFMSAMFVFYVLFAVIMYVICALFLAQIFKKAGVEGWIAWVPFYNSWKVLEIGGQQGFWAVLAIIPIVNYVSLVFMYIAMFHIGKKLEKSGAFVLWGIFLPIVWLIWLATDKSKWNDKLSSKPSLHKA